MRRIFAISLWLLTAATVVLFISGRWQWPRLIAAHGVAIDRQFTLTWTVIGVAFILTQALLGFVVWRFSNQSDESRRVYPTSHKSLEIFWTVATAVIFIGLAVTGQRVWRNFHFAAAPAAPFRVEVWGQQFAWHFHYAGADERLGRNLPELMNDAGGNSIGLDRQNDPAALDDIVAPTLVMPLNRPTELTLRARDVIHSLWLPNMRFKQDAVPGLSIRAYLTPTAPGLYDIACAELCGPQHYKMKARLLALPDEEFRALMSLAPDQWPAKRDELAAKYQTQQK